MCPPSTHNLPTSIEAKKITSTATKDQSKNMARTISECNNQGLLSRRTLTKSTTEVGHLVLPTANRVRTRYLSSLGIAPKSHPRKAITALRNSRPKPIMVQEPLKVDDDVSSDEGDDTSLSFSSTRSARSVSFDDSVSVCPIPMRNEYSSRIRKELWVDRKETIANVNRNAVEFAAEGWDWRSVATEDEMVRGQNGALIHPIHLHQPRCNGVQQQFMMRLSNHLTATQ